MMLHLIFSWVTDWLFGWGGVSLLVAIGAGLVWWSVPIPRLQTLAGGVAIGALAFNIAYTTGYSAGASETNTAWEKRGLENQIATLTLDLKTQRDIAALAKQSEESLTARATGLEQQLAEYANHVTENKEPDACVATDDDVRRLRNITGSGGGSDGAANPRGLRKSRPARALPRIW